MTQTSSAIARLSAFGLSFAMLVIAGCAVSQPPLAEIPVSVATVQAPATDVSPLINAMAERDRALESLQTSAVMTYNNRDDHLKAREEIIVRRPDSLRVEAMTPFGTVALTVAARDSHLQIFEPSKNTLLNGTADAATLARFARIPMAPRDAVGLLMGIVPEARIAAPPNSVTNIGGVMVLVYDQPDHSRRELGFQDGQLVMVRAMGPNGEVDFEIRYGDYHDIGGVMFAYQVDANFPFAETRVSFLYKRPIVNGKVPDSVFTLTPGPNAKQVEIGMTHGAKAGRGA